MRIVVDAMGGDRAPAAQVRGALSALRTLDDDFDIILVGDEGRIRPLLKGRYPASRLQVRHAPERIPMDESPSVALRRKRDSSVAVGLELQKAGEADAFVSTGNTGAVMALALTTLGRIESIARPAIVTLFPTERRSPCLVLDVGANVDSPPRHLLQFAVMGHIYAVDVLGRERPRVALLSIGEEPTKGDERTVAAHELLAESGLRFVGNVEGGDVLKGSADVVVCDGFVGNVLLKFGESFVDFLAEAIGEEVDASWRCRLGAALMRPAFASLRRRLDYAEYGGAPLLGVDGVVIVGHGGSSVKAVRNAIRVASRAARRQFHHHIESAVKEYEKRVEAVPPTGDSGTGLDARGIGGVE